MTDFIWLAYAKRLKCRRVMRTYLCIGVGSGKPFFKASCEYW